MIYLIDSTLREGEQSDSYKLSSKNKMKIIHYLNDFGIDYIEITNPIASKKSYKFTKNIMQLKKDFPLTFKSKILAHVRLKKIDIETALECGVNGLQIFVPGSDILKENTSFKNEDISMQIIKHLRFAKKIDPKIEIRISFEDSFRSKISDLIKIISNISSSKFTNRIGIADTLGTAEPFKVYKLIKIIKKYTNLPIEFHSHNDTGCAIANSFNAFLAGAEYHSVSLFGLGERNGITPLSGFIARILVSNKKELKKYRLNKLFKAVKYFSNKSRIPISPNYYIFGKNSFTHKAGIHTNRMLNNIESYQSINPILFNKKHNFKLLHPLTGHKSISKRIIKYGLKKSDKIAMLISTFIKNFF